jgi:hypothetical protein
MDPHTSRPRSELPCGSTNGPDSTCPQVRFMTYCTSPVNYPRPHSVRYGVLVVPGLGGRRTSWSRRRCARCHLHGGHLAMCRLSGNVVLWYPLFMLCAALGAVAATATPNISPVLRDRSRASGGRWLCSPFSTPGPRMRKSGPERVAFVLLGCREGYVTGGVVLGGPRCGSISTRGACLLAT